MDGKHRDTSMRLVLASVPLQALMMVGAAALVFGGAPASSVQNVQPLEGCPTSGYAPAFHASDWPSPDAADPALACTSPDFYYGQDQDQDQSPGAVYLPVPCCGG